MPKTYLNELLDIFREVLAQEHVPGTVKARVRAMFQVTERMLKEEPNAIQEKREPCATSEGGQVDRQADLFQPRSGQESHPSAPGIGARDEAKEEVTTRKPFPGFLPPEEVHITWNGEPWMPFHCEYGGHECWVEASWNQRILVKRDLPMDCREVPWGMVSVCPACLAEAKTKNPAQPTEADSSHEAHTDRSHSTDSNPPDDKALPSMDTEDLPPQGEQLSLFP